MVTRLVNRGLRSPTLTVLPHCARRRGSWSSVRASDPLRWVGYSLGGGETSGDGGGNGANGGSSGDSGGIDGGDGGDSGGAGDGGADAVDGSDTNDGNSYSQ